MALTDVAVCAMLLYVTVEADVKPEPLMVSIGAAAAVVAEAGARLVIPC